MKQIILLITIVLCWTTTAVAQPEGKIEVKSEAFKELVVTTPDGKREVQLVKPDLAIPGDTIFYVNTFKNIGGEKASNIKIDNPVPNNSIYLDGTAFGSGTEITFSVDNGKTYNTPEKLFVVKDGEKVTATAEDYTHIRWIFKPELLPGKESKVSFKSMIK